MKKFVPVLLSLSVLLAPVSAHAGLRWPWNSKPKQDAPSAKPAAKKSKEIVRVERDLRKLESILASMKGAAKLNDKSLKSAANEASVLATRIQTNVKLATSEKKMLRAANELHQHIQRLKKNADQGNLKRSRRHAARALSAATRLDELS
jgi:hypothetical protein